MHRVVSVEVRAGYRVHIRFTDGLEGEIDLGDLVGKGVFARWSDSSEFARAYVDPESGTVAWPGGIDLCPDSLHEDLSRGRRA